VLVPSLILDEEDDCTGDASSSSTEEMAPAEARSSDEFLVNRVNSVVEVAGLLDASVELETLVELLPEYGPSTVGDMVGWIGRHPGTGRISGHRVLPPSSVERPPRSEAHERADRYFRVASRLFGTEMNRAHGWVRFLGVTGSTAYADAREGDDCDLMAIVRPGTMWLFLAYVFLQLRLRRAKGLGGTDPDWCLNYTVDEYSAIREFSRPRGFQFAREALVARPIEGESYYRGLLRLGSWLREEAPRLYARWETTGLPEPAPPEPAPLSARCLNALLFPAIASYLHLKGLWANHRLRRSGRSGESFRTVTRLGQMGLETLKYERLSDRMVRANRVAPE
jgi:hypothetical protein